MDAAAVDAAVDARAAVDAPDAIDRCGSTDPDVRALCALAFWDACVPPSQADRTVRQTRVSAESLVALRECLNRAGTNCSAVNTCVGRHVEPSTEPCATHCEGDMRVRCDGTSRIFEDCTQTLPGNRCLPDRNGAVLCTTAACLEFPLHCTPEGHIEGCFEAMDRVLIDCPGDAFCARTVIDSGFFTCTGRGASCTQDRCESATRSVPCLNGQEGPAYDCGEGQRCGSSGRCEEETLRCMPAEYSLTCDGTDLIQCADGRPTRVSCTDLGFDSCGAREGTDLVTCR